jgi:hypothetical protein
VISETVNFKPAPLSRSPSPGFDVTASVYILFLLNRSLSTRKPRCARARERNPSGLNFHCFTVHCQASIGGSATFGHRA